jgi:hypothetical protein
LGAHAGHGRLFLWFSLALRFGCGLPALCLRLAGAPPAASGKKFGTEGRFWEIIVHGRDEEHYLLIDLLAGWQGIRYRSPI